MADAGRRGLLRVTLSVADGSTPAYWKHDGKRFAGSAEGSRQPSDWLTLCSASTLKLCAGVTYQLSLTTNQPVRIRANSGRWCVKEADARGNLTELPPQPPAPAQPLATTQPPATTQQLLPVQTAPASAPYGSSTTTTTSTQPAPGLPAGASGSGDGVGSDIAGAGGADADGGGGASTSAARGSQDPQALAWTDAGGGGGGGAAERSTYRAPWLCRLEPAAAGKRRYLCLQAEVEEFGLVECPIQIKVYQRKDKNALQTFPLRFIQYDFREDSSYSAVLCAVNYHRY